jgi:hypothetical protein
MFQRLLPANFLPIKGDPNCRRRCARPTLRREVKGQGRFPTVRFSKIVGLSYGQIQSPQRILSPWRQATFVATLSSQKRSGTSCGLSQYGVSGNTGCYVRNGTVRRAHLFAKMRERKGHPAPWWDTNAFRRVEHTPCE